MSHTGSVLVVEVRGREHSLSAEALKAAVILLSNTATAISSNWTNHKALPVCTHTHRDTYTHTEGKRETAGTCITKQDFGLAR